jgi:hypothetical protein
MPITASPAPDLSGALASAACLIAAAALVRAADAAVAVRVVVSGTDISIQVPPRGGDQAARDAAVAAYAQVLGTQVTRQHSRIGAEVWTETRGGIDGHDVHVWTITDPSQEA